MKKINLAEKNEFEYDDKLDLDEELKANIGITKKPKERLEFVRKLFKH